ncbi:MAG: hypothetical protein JW727_04280 [Candidatus Aenigmarchaeota archaeon]|nr:hypothetical protein [Candidatus Aenigmarchaeota archaeon]
MGVLGIRFTEISAKSGKSAKGDIQVSTSLPAIKSMKKMEVGTGKDKKDIILMEFDYSTIYQPLDARIDLKGELSYLTEESKKIMDRWNKDKKMDDKVSVPILNHLIKKCSVESIKLADDLQLPVPVKLPEIRSKEEKAKGKK